MNEFKLQKCVRELIDVCEAPASPEICIDKLCEFNLEYSAKPFSVDKCLNELVSDSPSSIAFLNKFELLQEKKLDILPKYIEMLYHIKQDKKLASILDRKSVTSLRSMKAGATPISSTLPELASVDDIFKIRNKLDKAVNQIYARMSSEQEDITVCKDTILKRRPHLTQDFIAGVDDLSPTVPLDGIPQVSQEFYLVEDVLLLMLGCSGKYITVDPVTMPYESRTFSIPSNIDIPLKNMLVQILPVVADYSVIVRFLEDKQPLDSGRINQALAAAINTLMTDYTVFVVQMETLHRKKKLKLEKLWYYVYPIKHSVSILSKIALSIGKSEAFGGRTLSVLHKEIVMTAANPKVAHICQFLLKSASVPFFVSLEKWINKGRVFDPFNEFMIEDSTRIESSAFMNKGECSDEFWPKLYMIRKAFVPTFLEKVGEKILRTGKYLNVIRQCKNKKVKEMFPAPIENLSYDSTNEEYINAIDKAYNFASTALLKLIMEEYDLVNRFKSAKRYFMLEQGDFLVLLMDSCEAELLKPIDDVVPNRLEVLLELAVRLCSGGKTDPYKDDICMVLHPYQFYFQLLRILNISTPKEMELQSLETEKKSQTGLEAFSLGLTVKWPMSLVFNQKVLAFYQMIFRLLLLCKHNERQLCRVWLCDKGVKMLDKQSRQGYLRAFSLRQKMLFCIQNFAFYITEEVIEPNFNTFMKELTKAKDIDYVLQLHLQYLEKSLVECMVTNPVLLESMKLIMSKCTEFCNFMLSTWSYSMEAELHPLLSSHHDIKPFIHKVEKQSSTAGATFSKEACSFQQTINQIDVSFTEILLNFLKLIDGLSKQKQFSKISNVFSRENFNCYYSASLVRDKTKPLNSMTSQDSFLSSNASLDC